LSVSCIVQNERAYVCVRGNGSTVGCSAGLSCTVQNVSHIVCIVHCAECESLCVYRALCRM
jgi:hypothetical protein